VVPQRSGGRGEAALTAPTSEVGRLRSLATQHVHLCIFERRYTQVLLVVGLRRGGSDLLESTISTVAATHHVLLRMATVARQLGYQALAEEADRRALRVAELANTLRKRRVLGAPLISCRASCLN
jgi:hypothetical protein